MVVEHDAPSPRGAQGAGEAALSELATPNDGLLSSLCRLLILPVKHSNLRGQETKQAARGNLPFRRISFRIQSSEACERHDAYKRPGTAEPPVQSPPPCPKGKTCATAACGSKPRTHSPAHGHAAERRRSRQQTGATGRRANIVGRRSRRASQLGWLQLRLCARHWADPVL